MAQKKGLVIGLVVFLVGLALAMGTMALRGDSGAATTERLAMEQPSPFPEQPGVVRPIVAGGASSKPSGGGQTVVVVEPSPEQTETQDEPEEPSEPDTDADDDGVEDGADNCPSAANADQQDFDGDGQGDACDPDDDNDNLSDGAEGGYGTNPFKKDTDGDGWHDGNEVNAGTDPLDPDSYPEIEFCFGCL